MGVGLHLYGQPEKKEKASKPMPQQATVSNRLSKRQHSFILNLAKDAGLSRSELDTYCRENYDVVLDHLPRGKASKLITELQSDTFREAS